MKPASSKEGTDAVCLKRTPFGPFPDSCGVSCIHGPRQNVLTNKEMIPVSGGPVSITVGQKAM